MRQSLLVSMIAPSVSIKLVTGRSVFSSGPRNRMPRRSQSERRRGGSRPCRDAIDTPAPRAIDVTLRRRPALIAVADNGGGIPRRAAWRFPSVTAPEIARGRSAAQCLARFRASVGPSLGGPGPVCGAPIAAGPAPTLCGGYRGRARREIGAGAVGACPRYPRSSARPVRLRRGAGSKFLRRPRTERDRPSLGDDRLAMPIL